MKDLDLCTEDKWILSRLASTIKDSLKYMDEFKLHSAGRGIYEFVINDLSRTYAQMIRDRISEDNVASSVLFKCLFDTMRLLASISPHTTEVIYQNMKHSLAKIVDYDFKESIHLELLPGEGHEGKNLIEFIDEDLESNFTVAMNVLGAVLAARDKAQIGIRWPMSEVIIDSTDEKVVDAVRLLGEVILNSANIKGLVFKKMNLDVDFKPNYKELGKAFGQDTSKVAELISSKKDELTKYIKKGEDSFKFHEYELKKSFFEIKLICPKEFAMGEFKEGMVFLKLEQDKNLEGEGFVREVTRRVQMLRKTMNLNKQDRIELIIEAHDKELRAYLGKEEDFISSKVGASSLEIVEKSDSSFNDVLEDKVKGKNFKIFAKKI
jgi:isoleucyl-tRNA synthetase